MIRVIVTGGHDVDESEFFRRDNALRHAHVRFVRTRIFLGQRIGEVRIREEMPSFPLKEKTALAQPPQMQGSPGARGIRNVFKKRFVLEDRPVSMGKARSNDIVLRSDPTVSRMHAVLERFAGGWCVRDLAARNGTFVNGQRLLGDCRLRSGDEIRLGATRLVFRAEGLEPDETEISPRISISANSRAAIST